MTNSETFYTLAHEFQTKRGEITSAYDSRMKAIETTKGSEYYLTESKAATEKRDSSLKALKKDYSSKFNAVLRAMSEANNRRTVAAPTADELAIVQALKLRDSVTVEELERAAAAVCHSELCLAALQEISHKMGFFGHNYLARLDLGGMSVTTVNRHIDALAKETRDYLEYDTKKSARLAADFYTAHYGTSENEPPIAKRKLFESKSGCFAELIGLDGADLSAFCAAVDG